MGNHYIRRFDLSKYTLKSFDSADEVCCDTNNSDAFTVNKNGTQAVLQDSVSVLASTSPTIIQGATAGGAAVSAYSTLKQVTAIADDVATTVFTVTVPNPPAGTPVCAAIDLTFLGILGAGGAVGAGESISGGTAVVGVTRTNGLAAVVNASTLAQTYTATVAGGDTNVFAYSVSAVSGGNTATQTFTIQVTIDDDTGAATNDICVAYATVLNANASGATIA